MKLAYAAYKPLKGQFSDIAPGKFMEPDIRSAQEELDDYGFESSIYNDGDNDTVCHVIGHKQIYANINYDTSDNTNGGANNATFGVYKNVSGSGLERGFSWDDSSGLRSDDYNNSVFTSSGRYSEAFWKALNSDGANNTDFMIKTNTNTNGGNNNGTFGILEGTGKHGTIGYFSDDFQSGLRTDVSMDSTGMSCVGSSEAFWKALNSNGANNTDCMIKTNTNTNGGNNNGYLGILEGTGRCKPIGVFSGSNQSGLRTDDFVGTVGSNCTGNSEIFGNTLNSDDANNTDFMIKTNTNTNGGNDNGSLGSFEKTIGSESAGVLNFDSQSNLWADVSVGTVGSNSSRNSEIFGKTLNSDNTNCMRTLVVVDIRGTSTNQDWMTDVGTQFEFFGINFETGMNMVLNSLYHGTGDTENCTKCNGGGCEHCKGYIPYNNISNPIFLVTGHSLGAAVANLVVENLNSCKDTNHCPGSRTEKDIYSYTFATPKHCI